MLFLFWNLNQNSISYFLIPVFFFSLPQHQPVGVSGPGGAGHEGPPSCGAQPSRKRWVYAESDSCFSRPLATVTQ